MRRSHLPRRAPTPPERSSFRGSSQTEGGTVMAERQLSFREAVREALREEMRRDERVFLMGISMQFNIVNHVVDGLFEEFGAERCISTPIVEAGFTGAAIGADLTGMRPVVETGN